MLDSQPRRAREYKTIAAMLHIYCRDQHATREGLCADCQSLLDYARGRLEKCPFQDAKPTCANCTVHCYKSDPRARVREVMRYAGPRMILRHPLLAIRHLRDGRRKAPALARRRVS